MGGLPLQDSVKVLIYEVVVIVLMELEVIV